MYRADAESICRKVSREVAEVAYYTATPKGIGRGNVAREVIDSTAYIPTGLERTKRITCQ